MSEKTSGRYQAAISECAKNGCALLDDAERMFDWERFTTAFALAILAAEGFSKAFLLYVVQDGAIPWSPEVRRAIRNHECKHLLNLIMDYLAERGEHWIENYKPGMAFELSEPIPPRLLAAMDLLRHDKIGKWADASWDVLEKADYDSETKRVSEGSVDRAKQSVIYVNIASDGTTLTTPAAVSRLQALREIERCKKLKELATDMQHGFVGAFVEYRVIKEVIQAVFDPKVIAVATIPKPNEPSSA